MSLDYYNLSGQSIEKTVQYLKRELSKGADDFHFRWLCACAVYPVLRLPLTVYLGKELAKIDGRSVPDEDKYLPLIRLPWFRDGMMPDEVRLALLRQMSKEDRQKIRSLIENLMKNPAAAPSDSGEPVVLDWWVPAKRDLRTVFAQLFQRKKGRSDQEDAIFVQYMMGDVPGRLDVKVNRNLAKYLGIELRGWINIQLVIGFIFCLLFSIVIWQASYHLLQTLEVNKETKTVIVNEGGKYASIVIDVKTGKQLYGRNERKIRYPASLVKMMTLYLLFRELKNGKIQFDSNFVVSKNAAMAPPSKIGLKPMQTITVKDAIQSLIVKSANDVAVVVAENLAGSERKFTEEMNLMGRRLGLTDTVFRNSSGLPHGYQITTAYDMALLGKRLYDDFPQYSGFFRTKYFVYRQLRYRNHNRLLFDESDNADSLVGIEGIKTGYTRASGFNIVTYFKKQDYTLIGVVLGGTSSRRRNSHMRKILQKVYNDLWFVSRCIQKGHSFCKEPGASSAIGYQACMAQIKQGCSERPVTQ